MSEHTASWRFLRLEAEEPLQSTVYQGHGYYPLQLGEIIGDHFQIIRKLGWAGSSSVWLARDCSEQGEVYCAVKVLTQNATLGVASENPAEMSYEAIVLNEIGEDRYSEHPALKHCIVVWETFIAYSQIPAVHLCIVMRPCAGTLRELQCSLTPKIFPFGTVKRVIRQTLIALKFFHEDLQFIHGDVQANNLIVDFYPGGDYEDISRRIHEYINMHPAETHVSGPSVPVQSQPLGNLGRAHKLNELNVRLSDYGSAIPIHMAGSGRPLETPLHSRAPEVLLGQPFSTAVDIWAVGCMAYALLFDRPLFQLNAVENSKLDLVHLSEMIQYLGPFPPPVVSKDQRRNFFDKTGVFRMQVDKHDSLDRRFRADARQTRVVLPLSESDICSSLNFLRRCFALDPQRRATAAALLSDPWLNV